MLGAFGKNRRTVVAASKLSRCLMALKLSSSAAVGPMVLPDLPGEVGSAPLGKRLVYGCNCGHIYIYTYICMYTVYIIYRIYIYIFHSVYIYIYVCVCVFVCVCYIYIYVYIIYVIAMVHFFLLETCSPNVDKAQIPK